MNFLVLGAGAQGTAAAFDLCRNDDVEVVRIADLDGPDLPPFLEPWAGGKLKPLAVDATHEEEVRDAMDGADAVVCALPYYLNLSVTRLAIAAGAHFCDLGGNTEIVEAQEALDEEAVEAGVSVIPDCGVAPGMVNVLAQAAIEALDGVDSVRVWVGGLPRDPEPPLNYQLVYSMEGVLDYYTTDALVLEGGELTTVEPLTGLESVSFPEPVGELEAFYTGGGISTLPRRYEGRIDEMAYKTLRYPGHAQIMKAIRDLGLLDQEPVEVNGCRVVPRRFFIDLVSPSLRRPEGRDVVAMRVEVRGRKDRVEKTIRWDMLDTYDEEHGITAMMRTTGFSLAVIALMQEDGRIEARGVRTPDRSVPARVFVDALHERGVHIERTDF